MPFVLLDRKWGQPDFGYASGTVTWGITSYSGLSFDSSEYSVADFDEALSAIHGMLPEHGLFISKTPALAGRWYLRPLIWGMQKMGRAPHVSFLSVEDLDTRIAAAGFRIVETGDHPANGHTRFIVAQKL